MATNFCIVAGIDLDIVEGQATLRYLPIGAPIRMFDGTLRASVRAVKREATVAVAVLSPAADATLRAALNNGMSAVTWTGDIINGASVSAVVEYQETSYSNNAPSHFRQPTLVIREV